MDLIPQGKFYRFVWLLLVLVLEIFLCILYKQNNVAEKRNAMIVLAAPRVFCDRHEISILGNEIYGGN